MLESEAPEDFVPVPLGDYVKPEKTKTDPGIWHSAFGAPGNWTRETGGMPYYYGASG